MLSVVVVVFMTLMMTLISDPRQWWVDYAQGQRKNIAQLMGYYNGMGVALCGDALSEYHNHQTALPSQCQAGIMSLASPLGAAPSMQYNVAFRTFTDGNTYIATTVTTQTIGHVSLRGITDDAILTELGKVADGGGFYVGHYSAMRGSIIMDNIPYANDGMASERIIHRTLMLPAASVPMRDGQPFIITMMY